MHLENFVLFNSANIVSASPFLNITYSLIDFSCLKSYRTFFHDQVLKIKIVKTICLGGLAVVVVIIDDVVVAVVAF